MKRVVLILLRALVASVAALSLSWGILRGWALFAAALGAAVGVVLGERLGSSRLRLAVAVGGALSLGAGSFVLAEALVSSDALVGWLGTSHALLGASVLRGAGLALSMMAALRALGTRSSLGAGLELSVLAASLPAALAAHRQGIIARPLWLSDWAWRRGIDPTQVFIGLGMAGVLALAIVLFVQGGAKRARSSLLVLAALAAVGLFALRITGLPTPAPPGLGEGSASASASGSAPPSPPAPPSWDSGADASMEAGLGDGGLVEAGSAEGAESDGGASGERAASEQLDQASSDGAGASPMAVVVLEDDYEPPSSRYYFRQEALSQWNGTRLVRASRSGVDLDLFDRFPTERETARYVPPEQQRSRVQARVALLVEHERPFVLESAERIEPSPNPQPARFKRTYAFSSLAQSAPYAELRGLRAGSDDWADDVKAHYLAGPQDPRYAALAKQIVSSLPERVRDDSFVRALAIKLYLDEEAVYSIRHKHAGAADPTADFLFGDRIGYCVHFAHAAVLLWRSLGLPARVATGYMVQESERQGGSSILIRSGDAHAWPEVFFEGVGWVVLDIAPQRNLDPPPPPQDDDLQQLLGEMARGMPPPEPGPDSDELEALKRFLLRLRELLPLGAGALLSLLVLAKLWRRLAPLWAPQRALSRVGYRAALDVLCEAGLVRRKGEGREAFARRVRAACPSFEAITGEHVRGALGRPGSAVANHAAWRAWRRALRGEVRRAVPLWRRALGLLDLSSIFRAK